MLLQENWNIRLAQHTKVLLQSSGAIRNFVREGAVTDVVRVQSLAILHKDHFDVTDHYPVYYNRM